MFGFAGQEYLLSPYCAPGIEEAMLGGNIHRVKIRVSELFLQSPH
jgi:hypothetical protein